MQSLLKPELTIKNRIQNERCSYSSQFCPLEQPTVATNKGNQKPRLQGRAKCRIFALSSMSFTVLGQSFRAVAAALN